MTQGKIKYLKLVLSIGLFLLSFISHAQEKSTNIQTFNGKKYYVHKVEKGQSLYAIAKLYNVDVNVLLAENDSAIDGIKAGQELRIPVNPTVTNTPAVKPVAEDTNRYVYHTVEKKETVYSITKKYSITDQKLLEWNPGISAGIKHGQRLIVAEKAVPVFTLTASPEKDTVVRPSKQKKGNYNIGLFLPFKFAESELIDPSVLAQSKSPFPLIQALSLDFYLGFKRAVDSLQTSDFKVNILLYDVDDKDSTKAESICRTEEFKTLDLIVGPLYPSGFKIVSAHGLKNGIPVVSPVIQNTKILFKNNYTSKINPSQFTLLESLADYCVDSLRGSASVFVVNNGMLKDLQYFKHFKQYYNDRLQSLKLSVSDSVKEVRGLAGVKAGYVPGKKNVFVLFTNNQVFLTDFITQLAVYADKKDIVLAGWQNVTTYENIDQDYLNRLSYTFPSQYNLSNIKAYAAPIRDYQAEVSSDPGDYFFQGFDIAQYFLENLKTQGPEFVHQLDKLPAEGNFLRYKFYRPDESTGFENKGVFVFKYNNYQLIRTGWK